MNTHFVFEHFAKAKPWTKSTIETKPELNHQNDFEWGLLERM